MTPGLIIFNHVRIGLKNGQKKVQNLIKKGGQKMTSETTFFKVFVKIVKTIENVENRQKRGRF